ncbi:capsular polysaccharide biosynthesis protein [Faunimonas sp. B44]|uniref:capsular polysaccharide biosynthesis protein n=1 Tax=Faunimonas sp. B44 TaxID=3461493 RepID=UPI004043A58B
MTVPARIALPSPGLWRIRHDLHVLTGLQPTPLISPSAAAVGGWGDKRSGRRAARWAARAGVPCLAFEDGFLRSVRPGRHEPALSYVIDRTGIYYATDRPNDLHALIAREPQPEALRRARSAIAEIRARRLSKYNDGRMALPDELHGADGLVMVVDQSLGDASIRGAGAGASAFEAALAAAVADHPSARIVVKTHPDNLRKGSAGHFASARQVGATIVADRINPWLLLERCRAVYAVSSLLGFEALMAGLPVICFGAPFYAGWGLTDDRGARPRAGVERSLEAVFAAAYLDYARYLDPYDRRETTLEDTIDTLAFLRDRFHENIPRTVTAGFSPWRQWATRPFLDGPDGPPINRLTLRSADEAAGRIGGRVALWSVDGDRTTTRSPLVRMEDGFLRSRGLGSELALPASLIVDEVGIYFDARHPSGFERIANEATFDEALLARAARLRERIVAAGVTKYNVGSVPDPLPRDVPGLRILVPGQVENDASIRFGSPAVRTNLALLKAVRAAHPDAFIAYKPHPDVEAAMRSGRIDPAEALRHADRVVTGAAIGPLFAWCDRVETMTSLAGFEALLRGRAVGTHGLPFYAGWGLTEDRLAVPRRARALTLDMLVAAALVLYPRYVDPRTRVACPPEIVIERLLDDPEGRVGLARQLAVRTGRLAGFLRNIMRAGPRRR